jgi:ribosomal protein S18 acetylase RimI-like enzyme
MTNLSIEKVDFNKTGHVEAFIRLMDAYMQHPMGKGLPLAPELAAEIIAGLIDRVNYKGFLVMYGKMYIALANCFENYSTFNAKPFLNIHDFVVDENYRQMGIGRFFLDEICNAGKKNGYCKVNLEVRNDNPAAMHLYQQMGFGNCKPPMLFWEKLL